MNRLFNVSIIRCIIRHVKDLGGHFDSKNMETGRKEINKEM